MNLHITPDDKFIDVFIENYEDYHDSTKNIYVCISNENKLQYIKNKRVKLISSSSKEYNELLRIIIHIDNVYCHCFTSEAKKIVGLLPKNVTVLWIFWGIEFYRAFLFQKILDKFSTKYILSNKRFAKIYGKFGFALVFKQLYKIREYQKLMQFAISVQRVDYFLHWNKLDYRIVKKALPKFHAEFINFVYPIFPITKIVHRSNKANRFTLLVGNSATPINNHISILRKLKRINLKIQFQIICPLSYGDKQYREYIVSEGRALFGERFTALVDFLPKDEYFQIIENVDCVIMNHIRTAGAGVIFYSIQAGKKVFMHPENTQYKMLKDMGIVVYSNQEINEVNIAKALVKEDIVSNHQLLKSFIAELSTCYENIG